VPKLFEIHLTIITLFQGTNMIQEAAADAVIAFLQNLEDNNNQDEIQLEILNSVSRLEQAYIMSVTNEDLDRY